MMKYILLSLLLIQASLVSSLKNSNNIPVIDVFIESLCPDCMEFIGGSFKQYQSAVDHEQLAVVNFYPFGNAKESWNGSNWTFECQHGPNECYGNTIEACALNHLSENEGKNFLICIEGNIVKLSKNFDKAVEVCVSDENTRKNILECANGSEGNKLMHEVAQKTPKHNYVPWVHFNGEHDVNKENKILSNMLDFLRKQDDDYTIDDIVELFDTSKFNAKKNRKSCLNLFGFENLEKLNFLE
jgi:interferon gamma-inducible protein 30